MLQKLILKLKNNVRLAQFRSLAQLSANLKENPDRMQTWQIHSYNGPEDLKFSNIRVPMIRHPTDVLVKIEAASVNPIDVAMTNGYGTTVLNLMRKVKNLGQSEYDELELPLTLGRDFAGVIVSKGHGVGNRLKLGEEVWGVVPIEQQGSHANYTVVDSNLVSPRPKNLSYIEAASILYAGLTAWSALWITGGLSYKMIVATKMNRRVLVMGGSGGVGTLAIQLLKAWNMIVISTCSTDAVDTLMNLGADIVIDYKQNDADAKIISEGPYDIILDCANQGPELVKTKRYPYNTYIALNPPLLKNIDQHGLIVGMAKNIGDLLKFNIPTLENKSCVKWGFFVPSRTGMNVIQKLVEDGKIVPVVQQVYSFQDLPLAYKRMKEGHLRGKLVIDIK
ncbi:reticulon-4-interacting protein 1, mitochondrial [Pseudomyrmex gracilis]|uniref:reticulon-4-interacting protein 1, mitochondrial n=1 Tax=Pseudomyrmex gracilis TaxID=219809 RepID=UPI000994D7D2|nr:reticulon-4-interacting protein 1, mitochondrial [Pseudomyrmex gracilis]